MVEDDLFLKANVRFRLFTKNSDACRMCRLERFTALDTVYAFARDTRDSRHRHSFQQFQDTVVCWDRFQFVVFLYHWNCLTRYGRFVLRLHLLGPWLCF